MPSTSPTSRKPLSPSWNDLATEIRLLILESLMDSGYPLSRIATVSRESQDWIEPRNFARLRITPPRLPNFPSMVHRNRAHVRYIWFCSEIPGDDCVYVTLYAMDSIIEAFKELFQALSIWEPHGHLTLDIGVWCQDTRHWFPYLTFMPETPSAGTLTTGGTIRPLRIRCIMISPMAGGLARDCRPRHATAYSGCSMLVWLGLVTDAGILGRFPRLQKVHYEFWRGYEPDHRAWTDEDLQSLIESVATHKTLKKLVLFENFNQQYPRDTRRLDRLEGAEEVERVRTPKPAFGQAVALACLEHEHIAASFLVDARHFFSVDPSLEWRKLISLRLTSGLLTPAADSADVEALLQAAAAAITKMPRLESMEIWNGRKGLAGLFRYHAARTSRRAFITWRGTWRLDLELSVTQAWENAVAKLPDSEDLPLFWLQEEVDVDVIKSHGDAIHHLKLSDHVIRPVSLQQILREQDALKGVPTDD